MAQIDPVILQLRAELQSYKNELRSTTVLVERQLGQQERAVVNLESQIKRSSAEIGNSFRGLAGTLAGALSAREVAQVADSYTRFTNQLKVAGLEGERLAGTQEQLFQVAQRNGVGIEAVGTLYSRAAQNQRELGASSADLVNLTRAVAASLRISGTSTEEASGALLQLGQALGSPRVQAEEFNSLLDTMGPLLREASKFIDGTGNSLSGLTRKIKDQNGPGVSNVELFRAIVKAMQSLEAQAGKTSLTISGAFQTLSNAITKYVGEADQANGASAAVTAGLNLLANNLGTVTEALAVIGTVLAGRYVAGMVAATAASGAASTAIFALQARAAGAATTMEALGFAGAAAGRTVLAAFGGPVGLAVTALALGVGYLLTTTNQAAQASAQYQAQQEKLAQIQNRATEVTDKLAVATGRAREQALNNAKALRQETIQYLANAKAALEAARAKAVEAETRFQADNQIAVNAQRFGTRDTGLVQAQISAGRSEQAQINLRAARKNVDNAEKELARLNGIINAPAPKIDISLAAVGGGKAKGTRATGGGRVNDPAEAARRFQDQVARAEAELAQVQAELIGTTAARAAAERQRIELDRAANERAIVADKDLSAAQKARLLALNDQTAQAQIEVTKAREAEQARQDALNLALSSNQDQADLVQAQARLAVTVGQRRDLELRLLDLQEQEERLRLEAIANNQQLNAAEREAARNRLAALPAIYDARRRDVNQQNETPGQRYRRQLNESLTDINSRVESIEVQGLQDLEDSLVNSTKAALGLKGALGDIVGELIRIGIQRSIIGPLADGLFGPAGGGGGGGLFGSFFGGLFGGGGKSFKPAATLAATNSLFGRASGGYVAPGQMVRVNEAGAPGRVEGFRPVGGGNIVPLGQMNALRRPSGATIINQTFQLDARGAVTTREFVEGLRSYTDTKAQEAYRSAVRDAPDAVSRRRRYG